MDAKNDKLIVSDELDVSLDEHDEEDTVSSSSVLFHYWPIGGSQKTYSCTLSSLDKSNVTLVDFPLEAALEIIHMSNEKSIYKFTLEASGFNFAFNGKSDVYLSVVGNLGMLSLTERVE